MIRVSNIMSAQDIAIDMNADAIVSIIDHDIISPTFDNRPLHLVKNFIDTEIHTDMFAPVQDDIDHIFDFVLNRDFPLKTLVHCQGGISRSVATGIGLWIARGMSVDNAVRLVHADRPNLAPNRLVLQLIDNLLGLNNTLVKDVSNVLNTIPKDLMLWCDKCKFHFVDGNNCKGNHFI